MTAAAATRSFDVCGPLPEGVTVLEASAGTGKTFAIAALAARYLAEGALTADELLVVTFTRAATGELRERVRERLVGAEAHLAAAAAGAVPAAEDEVLRLLAAGPAEALGARRARLARALADFDAATITTIHGFCRLVLGGLGVGGDVEAEATFLEDSTDLIDEVIDDLYVRRFRAAPARDDAPRIPRAAAREIARAAVANPRAPLEPRAAPHDSTPAMRARFAAAVREEFERRKRRAGVLTYDDLQGRLAATLEDPERGPRARDALRRRYRAVLIDEFQDTDPVQWGVVARAFGDGALPLVLIGDPKQAIYAFRGADVYAYLAAARIAGRRATLPVNYRSDAPLLAGLDALFGDARLGHEGIAYLPVRAAPANARARLSGAPAPAALRIRVLRRDDPGVTCTATGLVQVDSGRARIAADLAEDVARLLLSPATVADAGGPGAARPVRPGDVGVLVRTHRQAGLVRDALAAADVPTVIAGAGSVFRTDAAGHWLHLLRALERPGAPDRLAAAALTPFVGWTAERLALAGEDDREALAARLHGWADVLRRRGVASLAARIDATEGLPARMLAVDDGERALTDLRHVAQLLHAAVTGEGLGAPAAAAWLEARIADAAELGDEEGGRRLESDAEAVQVLTIHASKGLEFPVVHLPYLWDFPQSSEDGVAVFHDPEREDVRTLDVGGRGSPGRARHVALWRAEERGEDLRLAYVALTRARHQAVVWWAGSQRCRDSPLCRLLFAGGKGGEVGVVRRTPDDDALDARLADLAARAPGDISVERVAAGAGAAFAAARAAPADLAAARFSRTLDVGWRRASYSGITARAHEARVASEPEAGVVSDERPGRRPGAAPPEGAGVEALRGHALPLDAMPAGAAIGTFVHAVLEAADLAAPDLRAELRARVAAERGRAGIDVGGAEAVVTGLAAAVETPLGPVAGELRLRDVTRADRRDEMNFELPLVGGDRPHATLPLAEVAALIDAHLPAEDPLAGYGRHLADPALQRDLRGYLVGSIDMVVRLAGGRGYAVIDHKTNRLGPPAAPGSAWDYRPEALAREMRGAHYALQALLYLVALHRYLRWRLAGYAPERDLAGVLHLFLRGMTGPDTPRVGGAPCGVFGWRPPAALVTGLSDLLHRGAAA